MPRASCTAVVAEGDQLPVGFAKELGGETGPKGPVGSEHPGSPVGCEDAYL